MKHDGRMIEITDAGAGSKKLNKLRKVSDIFTTSSSRGRYGLLLYCLARHFKPEHILEFGTSLGIGTAYLQLGNPDAEITTIEACPETRKIANENFAELGEHHIRSINSTFREYLDQGDPVKYDLVFVDGHHDGKALLEYMRDLEAITHDHTVFILDDIRWSQSMWNTWLQLANDPAFHVSIDFFRCGLLVRRPEQHKEHFYLHF